MLARTEHPYYELLEPCGEGGMGVVYRALDRRLNRIVALKFLAPGEIGRTNSMRRFQREAQAIAALNHPNVATVYEAGEWDGAPFLALEYLPGGTLRSHCRGRRLMPREIVEYAAQLGAGLAYAHQRGILHRDIKPSNAMFSEHRVLKLVDFGLAKWREATNVTRPGGIVGTIPYMAPEIVGGDEASARSDLYSFGALVYELAAGRPLFAGARTESLLRKILDGELEALGPLRPDLPPRMTAAIHRAVSRNPQDRFASVHEFTGELKSAVGEGTGQENQETRTMTSALPWTSRFRQGRPWAYAAAAVIALGGMVGISSRLHVSGPSLKTVVVLPLENLAGDAEDQAFCDGLQETITDTLASAAGLRNSMLVVPSSEVRRNQITTISDARKQFSASLVITGGVQKNAGGVSLTLNLSDAKSLRQQGSRTLQLLPEELAGLQDRLGPELGALLSAGPVAPAGANRPGQTTPDSAAYQLYVKGKGAMQDLEWDQAADYLRHALEIDPRFALARAKLAEAYWRKYVDTKDPKWLALADSQLNEAAEQGRIPAVVFVQAMIWKATGQAEKAIPLFRELQRSDPDNLEAYTGLAEVLESAGHIQEAETTYQTAIRLRPGYWPTYRNLGAFYMNRRENANAEQALLIGIAVAPAIPALHSNLGALYFGMSRWDDAAREFEKSVALKPYALGYANLGTVRFYEGRYPEAARQFEEATKLQPANATNWGNLGDARWQLPGDRERARDAFNQAALLASQDLALNPKNVAMRKRYALYFAKLGRSNEALREAATALEQAPKDRDVQYWAARVYAVTGDLERARSAAQAALALGYDPRAMEQEPDLKPLRDSLRTSGAGKPGSN